MIAKRETIAIVGGGVSGALTAYHLRRRGVEARVVMVEPRAELGLGLAYSTPTLVHLLNVPAGRISALPQEPGHFLAWLHGHGYPDATAATFAPRAVFGRYIRDLLAGVEGVEQVRARAVALEPRESGAVLLLDNGRRLEADRVVLATGNFDPTPLPGVEDEAVQRGVYWHNAWLPGAYQGLAPDAPVTLIGSGLTAVDVLLRLRELGHKGTITAVSRHGMLPNRHAAYLPAEHSAVPLGTPARCTAYLRALRASIACGVAWRPAVDSLRTTTNELWLALSEREQRRFRRHLQRRWDVVRHRMAPPIADWIDAELGTGMLRLRAGSLAAVRAEVDGATVVVRARGGMELIKAARVINCTGPGMDYRRAGQPLLMNLFAQGLVRSGPLGAGLETTRCGAVVSASGEASETLFTLGPGRLGTLLESIAIPEIRDQAAALAALLLVESLRGAGVAAA